MSAGSRAERDPDERRTLDTQGVEHGKRIARRLAVAIGGRLVRTVRSAVARGVERDDAAVAGEIRHLRLPLPPWTSDQLGRQRIVCSPSPNDS